MTIQDKMATQAQIQYATDLLDKLGYDVEEYDLNSMTKDEISELIRELKDEWEG